MEDTFVATATAINELHFRNLKTIDGLDEFLAKADPMAILAWLAQDDRAVRWKSASVNHGQFGNRPHHAKYTRFYDGPIPSYIRWRLRTTAWLPRRNGVCVPTGLCFSCGHADLRNCFPFPDGRILPSYIVQAFSLRSYAMHLIARE